MAGVREERDIGEGCIVLMMARVINLFGSAVNKSWQTS